jgi:hypothetical protein
MTAGRGLILISRFAAASLNLKTFPASGLWSENTFLACWDGDSFQTHKGYPMGDRASVVSTGAPGLLGEIYVDALLPWPKTKNWPYGEACHLFTDPGNLDALHRFAASIGLKRQWFQDASSMPHYDLTRTRRAQAVKRGAVEVDRYKTVEVLNHWRESRKQNA